MVKILNDVTPQSLSSSFNKLFELSGEKIALLHRSWDPGKGTPVFTIKGVYTSRGWTDWTQGFQFGSALLQFDAAGDKTFLEMGRGATVKYMATHVSHIGV